MTTSITIGSFAGLDTHTLPEPSDNNHNPAKFTEKRRNEIKKAFRLAINKSRTHDEAMRLTKLRTKFFSPGGMTEDEAILAWLEVTLISKPGRPGQNPGNNKFSVKAA